MLDINSISLMKLMIHMVATRNSMRELRANQTMGVFASEAGFGSDETVSSTENPMLADTGLTWPMAALTVNLRGF